MSSFKEGVERAKRWIFGREIAYKHTFDPQSQSALIVLADLAKFCRAHESTFHADPRLHAVLEGRREVWLRIQNHMEMSSKQLWEHYGRKDLE